MFNTIIPRNVRLAEAPSFGKPILLYDIGSIGAQSYLNVAEELIKRASSRARPPRDFPASRIPGGAR